MKITTDQWQKVKLAIANLSEPDDECIDAETIDAFLIQTDNGIITFQVSWTREEDDDDF